MDTGPTRRTKTLGLTAIDLFCGAGGLSEGFRAAGYDIRFALDHDFESCETYRLNHPTTKIEHASITDRTPAEFARMVGDVDVILGGPSCQGFSTHGRRYTWANPDDERNKLWHHMHAIVTKVKPRAFLLENVPGLHYYSDGHISGEIITRFEKAGYTVHRQILLAADYGVPQLRRRIFVVGVAGGYEFEFPKETHLGGWRRDTLDLWERERARRKLLHQITCWEAIGDLPPMGDESGKIVQPYTIDSISDYTKLMRTSSKALRDHEASPMWGQYAGLLEHVPPGGTWRDIPPHLLPDRYRGMRRTDSTNLLGRLDPNRPAYTITTQYNNVTAGCFTHPFENRPLSVREGARLQSFPDRYEFVGSITGRCRQIGNAVPPLLAQHLACAIADAITEGIKPKKPKRVPSVKDTGKSLTPPSATTRTRMINQSRHDTQPEVALRKELFALGLRYKKNVKPIEGLRCEVDILFTTEKVAVFVDGCFWHGCPKHTRDTKSNTKWWAEKIARNRERDAENTELLRKAGYRVVRIWEHEDPARAALRVQKAVLRRR